MKKFLVLLCFTFSCFFIYTFNVSAATVPDGAMQHWYYSYNAKDWAGFYECNNTGNICAPSSVNVSGIKSFMFQFNSKPFSLTKGSYYAITFSFVSSPSQKDNIDSVFVILNTTGTPNAEVINWSVVSSSGTLTTVEAKFKVLDYPYQGFSFGVNLKNSITYNSGLGFGFNKEYFLEKDESTAIIQEQQKTNEKLDETNKNLKETNDTLKDDKTDEAKDKAGGFFNDFESNDFGLSDIVTMPLTFIQGLASSTCNSLNLPMPFVNHNVELPCMTQIYEDYFGSFLTIYQIITTGIISYWVCINVFRLVQGFKNPDKDDIEVMDL